MLATRLLCAMLVLGCDEAPGQPRAPALAPPPPPPVPSAASALAKTFAVELVGSVTPTAPVAGDYAMTLALRFETFVTTELRITETRKGAMKLNLARAGTASACLGLVRHHSSQGQFHYERDPAKRRHSESDTARLSALAGTWKVADGVAVIRFDRSIGATCDPAKAIATSTPVLELRCLAVTATTRVPAGLLCEATERQHLLDLGLTMTEASRSNPGAPRQAPGGAQIVLGSPGVVVEVTQARTRLPAITFRAGVAPLVEADYAKPR